jgi:manganese efflux pump family protein
MAVVALVIWLGTAAGGLYLLAIWLIEYDRDFQATKATRLPIPVIGTHALLAVAGLAVWSAYVLLDSDRLAWTAVAILGVVAALGVVMARRWFRSRQVAAVGATRGGPPGGAPEPVPPERHFPLPVVIGHGVFAVVTITLVLLTALGVGSS